MAGARREGEKSAKENRESNRPAFFSSSKSPVPLMPTLHALYESKKRKGFWSFRFCNRETLGTRLGATTSPPLTSGNIQKICMYVIYDHDCHLTANERKRKMAEFFRCAVGPQLYRIFTRNSRQVSFG